MEDTVEREKRAILIVDGSASFIFYTAMMLKKLQYDVLSATTAEEALSLIARSAPAVVITDTVLPGTSGQELLRRIKKTESIRFIPVIIHSSDANPAVEESCRRAGCTAFLSKPAAPESLFSAIQAATEATPRHHIRIRTSLRARIAFPAGKPERSEEVTQLSEGGIFITTPTPAPKGAVLPLILSMPNHDIRLSAVVLYSSVQAAGAPVPGMGMKFTDVKPDDLVIIREFIRQHVMNTIA